MSGNELTEPGLVKRKLEINSYIPLYFYKHCLTVLLSLIEKVKRNSEIFSITRD